VHEEYVTNIRVRPPEPKKPKMLAVRPTDDDPFVDDQWQDAWTEYADFDCFPEEAEYGYIRDF
jgi:hypothetical protein